jgi:uncharacterized protein (TIGR03437 family)
VLTSAGDVLYGVSESGVLVLPMGSLNRQHRIRVSAEDLVIRGNFCDRGVITQELTLSNPGGGNTGFTIVATTPGVSIAPASGTTPATVHVRVDAGAFSNLNGTLVVPLEIHSATAINVLPKVRLLINNRQPDQRGTMISAPGRLVDILADPVRDRFYVLRQDRNEVLVYEAGTYNMVAALRTSSTPTQLALAFDRRHLLIAHENAQVVDVYDLDTLERLLPIAFPLGHYPRSIAASGKAMLAVARAATTISPTGGSSGWIGIVSDTPGKVDRVDFFSRRASTPDGLGIFPNDVHPASVVTASPNGASILIAMPGGNLMLYNANADTVTVSRKDFTSLSGPYGASSYDQFAAGNHLLNASLVPVGVFEGATGAPSGVAFVDQWGFRTTSSSSGPGLIARFEPTKDMGSRATRMVESPLTPVAGMPFTRTVAPLYNRSAVIVLTTSGFTVLPWSYDAAVAPPRISQIVNAADQTQPVAPGGLITIEGSELSPVNVATRQIPLPTALGESCLTVNGVPVPMIFVSSTQINGQLPYDVDGNATMTLHTPGGVSDNFHFTIYPAAPRIFRTGTAGPETGIATVVRAVNNELVTLSNPIHPGDVITIYATGLGRTSPPVESGYPAPADPLPAAIIPPLVTLGGTALEVRYAGLTPAEVGVYQINAAVPGGVPTGMEVPLTLSQAGISTTLNVRVVK